MQMGHALFVAREIVLADGTIIVYNNIPPKYDDISYVFDVREGIGFRQTLHSVIQHHLAL